MPLNTRLGVAHAPIEPGERCFFCTPWLRAQAREPVASHDAAEALALGHAHHVDLVTGGEHVGAQLLAGLVGTRVVGTELHDVAARLLDAVGGVVALHGLGDWFARASP